MLGLNGTGRTKLVNSFPRVGFTPSCAHGNFRVLPPTDELDATAEDNAAAGRCSCAAQLLTRKVEEFLVAKHARKTLGTTNTVVSV